MVMVQRADMSKKAVYMKAKQTNILILNTNLSDEETGQIIKGYVKADSSCKS